MPSTIPFLGLGFRDLLFSIRSRVAVFSLLATLVPSITLGWLSYDRNASVLRQKAEHEIASAGLFAAREADLWVKERIYEMRVIGSSHLIAENLPRIAALPRSAAGSPQRTAITAAMQDYLRSVGTKFSGYTMLQVATPDGDAIAGGSSTARLPAEWLADLRRNQVVVGEPAWNPELKTHTLPVVVPLRSAQGKPLGHLLAVIEATTIEKIIARFALADGEMYVASAQGRRIVLGQDPGAADKASSLPGFEALRAEPGNAAEYRNHRGQEVVGTLLLVPQTTWGIVVERPRDVVLAQVYALRTTTFMLVLALVVAVGLGAYGIGLTLVHPLDRLVGGANRVASGDLAVTLPVARRDELGKLTEHFNEMTAQLRKNREELAAANDTLLQKNAELEALSVTDPLTGLHNRRYLMDTLEREFTQRTRNGRVFTLLMVDLDHFKRINDNYGHPAGDAVLVHTARIFREEIRSVDYAARFGGEEFTLLLMDSGAEDARVVAERIRGKIAASEIVFEGRAIPVTASIGLAQVAGDTLDTATALIGRADAALYEAKHGGRNRVVCDDGKVRRLPPAKAAG